MKAIRPLLLTTFAVAALAAGAWAEENPKSDAPAAKPAAAAAAPAPAPVTAADVQALKDALAAQQQQIEKLTQQLQQQQSWQQNHPTAADAGQPDAAQVQAVQQQVAPPQAPPQQLAAVAPTGIPAQQETAPPGNNMQEAPAGPDTDPMHGPVSIHFKGITITPGGFAAAEFVRRSRALGADVPTPFNSLTMPGASQSTVSEFFGSARQSRMSVYFDGRLSNVKLSSYVSADFLSAGVTSSATQTNSYTVRLRQAWGQARFDNGWSFLGGQMWSLLTENKRGIAPSDDNGRVNDARPMTIDPQYTVGFTFARQWGLRITKNLSDKVAFAVAVENAEGTLTTHNNGDNFLLGLAGASNSYNTSGTYTFNPSPDVIAKLAFDPGFGHYEIFGLYDRFTDRVFPCGEVAPVVPPTTPATYTCNGVTVSGPNATGAYNASRNGGGFGANARWTFADNHIVFGLHGFGGSGVGRYGAAQLSDLTIHANGTVDPIKNLQGLASLEWHGKKLDLYAYAGSEYDSRAADFDTISGKYVGYGSSSFNNYGCYIETPPSVDTGFTPGTLANCAGDTRAVIEGTLGFWYRFYNGPKGKFQFGTQYSYVTRETWSGQSAAGAGMPGVTPSGLDNMVYTSFRYYLP